jgi:hypothetical protein
MRCRITLSGEDGDSMGFVARVYPIDCTRREIVKDEDCVCINEFAIRKMLTRSDNIPKHLKAGLRFELKVTFNIENITVTADNTAMNIKIHAHE